MSSAPLPHTQYLQTLPFRNVYPPISFPLSLFLTFPKVLSLDLLAVFVNLVSFSFIPSAIVHLHFVSFRMEELV